MVLESLTTPLRAERRPWELLLLGFLYTSIAMFISIQIFEQSAGLIAVFLTVMACIPLVYATIKFEEHKDILKMPEIRLLQEHSKALSCFTLLFLGGNSKRLTTTDRFK